MKNPKKNKKKNWKIIVATIVVAIVVAATIGAMVMKEQKAKEKEITYDQLYQDIIDHKVEKIEMTVGSSLVTVKYKDTDDKDKKQLMLIHFNHLWNL